MSRSSHGKKKGGSSRVRTGGLYVDGNTVRKIDRANHNRYNDDILMKKAAIRKSMQQSVVSAERVSRIYIFFLVAVMVICSAVCIWYVSLCFEVTAIQKKLSGMESQLNNLRLANEEEYDRIIGAVDMEEIKRIAMDELGMKYPDEGQVVSIPGQGDDYVRQYEDIPEK